MAVSGVAASANTQASQALSPHHRHGGHRAASISDVGAPSSSPASSGRATSGVGNKLNVKV